MNETPAATWTRPAAWDAVDIIARQVGSGSGIPEAIRALLASDNPAVHAAMVEALSNHGFACERVTLGRVTS